ncbi:hypothetical protein [Spirosoma sp. KNUC1025]|uniref:hypothetical protein n=1 Tax=Spirosoma sp. KNUC1025 TaxID=2894082 RepID=UPI00386C4E78|nr:hypothetical protein LN737_17335 [Spirosoma sp. KNUC1025]
MRQSWGASKNVYTTNMAEFINQAGYRNSIYKKHFPPVRGSKSKGWRCLVN